MRLRLRLLRRFVAVGLAAGAWAALGSACSTGPESPGRAPLSPSGSAPADSASVAMSAASFTQVRFDASANPFGLAAPPEFDAWARRQVDFPPRNESLTFRLALEVKYRDGLRRSAVSSYVDAEGTVVWVQEYIRYRVNLCSHSDAIARVFRQIDGFGVQPTCGTAATAVFPPRQEPLDFMVQLEAKYRDGLRRQPGSSFVDVEGNVIWTQEYLRYRAGTCSHTDAQQKVFDQIDGRGVQPDCTPQVTIVASACACAIPPIEIRIGTPIAGTMGCSETRSFPAPAGSYLVTACARNGCFGGNYFGPFTGNASIRLIC